MGKALYRKHRPRSLSEVVGQEHITATLEQALKQKRISHAYLFTGPKGVGKTSIARILAHEINGLSYTDGDTHLDIIEIDAASNRRIDEIRELRDKVYVAPTSAHYKVYIIDEVHMLTKEAFNALLKTLEEPPEHVVFMLATTDAHKLPETIISRTQRYTFKPVEKSKVVAHLRHIAQLEKITIEDSALEMLAEHGEGSFRDSISLLDQASSHGQEVTLQEVQDMLGLPPEEIIKELIGQLSRPVDGLAGTARLLAQLFDQGYLAALIAKQLAKHLREMLIGGGQDVDVALVTTLLSRLLEVPGAYEPERMLEIILLEATPKASSPRLPTQAAVEAEAEDLPATLAPPEPEALAEPEFPPDPPEPEAPPEAKKPKPSTRSAPASETPPKLPSKPVDGDIWPAVLSALKQRHNTLYGIVRMAEPAFGDDGTLTLAFAFAFHQKRLNDAKHQQVLGDIVEQISGQAVRIECVVDKSVSTTPSAELEIATAEIESSPNEDAALSTISNIFGGGELLE